MEGQSPLEGLSLQQQTAMAANWVNDPIMLQAFMDLLQKSFDEDDDETVNALCVELIANQHLPPLPRAKVEVWMCFQPDEDAGERLDTAESFLADSRTLLEQWGRTHPDVDSLQEVIDELRGHLVPVEDVSEVEEEASQSVPANILQPAATSDLAEEQIQPGSSVAREVRLDERQVTASGTEEAEEEDRRRQSPGRKVTSRSS